MTVTLTANYKEVFKPETVAFIEENCIEGDYDLENALTFIDEHNEDDFVQFYDIYIDQGERCGYDAVDAFIEENGIVNVEHTEDAFVGCYDSEADFAEELFEDLYTLPVELVIDWQATWDSSVRFDYDFCNGYVFRSNY